MNPLMNQPNADPNPDKIDRKKCAKSKNPAKDQFLQQCCSQILSVKYPSIKEFISIEIMIGIIKYAILQSIIQNIGQIINVKNIVSDTVTNPKQAIELLIKYPGN